jgi:hypothetical protein
MPISSVETINGTGSYCAAAGWQKQKKSNQACTENFECQGNVCEQGKCKGGKEKSAEGNRNLLLFLSIAAVFIIAIILLLVSRLKKR